MPPFACRIQRLSRPKGGRAMLTGRVDAVTFVDSKQVYLLHWRELTDACPWRQGWA